jgi:hypothetical protein
MRIFCLGEIDYFGVVEGFSAIRATPDPSNWAQQIGL